MKIYLFNPETGMYLGEDFADDNPMQRGVFVLPPDATTIAPPQAGNGQIVVFNFNEERWEVRPKKVRSNDCRIIMLPFVAALFKLSILH